jgi:predicted MFS family arabinose efflux permease
MPPADSNTARAIPPFTPYQKFVTALLAFLQFAVVLDFMIISPLGALIMPGLSISPKEFSTAVSAYAFAAGIAGILIAGLADRFDRKRLLLLFYGGFLLGTLWCGLAQTYPSLLAARIVTGLFGGVIGSVSLAIVTDLFPPESRGRVMGLMQTAFAASQVLGLPVGLYLSNRWDWHAPFFAMAALGLVGGVVVAARMQPVNAHLALAQERSAFRHLSHTVMEPRFLTTFLATALLATGGFMLMPFGSAYTVNNLGISLDHLPMIYLATGLCVIVFGPLIGRAADSIGKLRVFVFGSIVSIATVLTYTRLGVTPLPVVIAVNVVMFVGIFSRMIPFQAMVAGVPEPTKRGSFNAISAAIQQLSGGLAALIAGHIVTRSPDGRLQHMDVVGDVVVGTTLVSLWLFWRIHRQVQASTVAPSPEARPPLADA